MNSINRSTAKSISGLKRPSVLFAVFFAASSFLCAKGFVSSAFFVSLTLASIAVITAFLSKLRTISVFCLLLSFFMLCPAIVISVRNHKANATLFDGKNSLSSQAVVQDKTEMYNKTVLYVTLSDKQFWGQKTAVIYDGHFASQIFDKIEICGIPFSFDEPKDAEFYTEGYPTKEKALGKGCVSGIYATDIKNLGRIPENERTILHNYYFYINDNLKRCFDSFGAVDTFSYATALLTGDRAFLSDSTVNSFTRSGLVAVLCISGLHVVISTEVLGFFLKKLRVGKLVRSCILIGFLILIIIITGFRGSVMRAAVMSMIFYLARITRKRLDQFSTLATAFVVVSLSNPFCIFDTSTLLSFLAMTGLVFSGMVRDEYFEEKQGKYNFVRNSLSASFHAQTFASLPVIEIFGGISLVSPFSNLFVSIFFSPLMFFLVLCAFLCFIPPQILSIVAFLPKCLIVMLEFCAKIFASIPYSFASFSLPDMATYAFAALFMVFLLSTVFCKNKYVVITGFCCFAFNVAVTLVAYVLSFICN